MHELSNLGEKGCSLLFVKVDTGKTSIIWTSICLHISYMYLHLNFNQNWLSYWNAFHSLDFVATGDGTPKRFFPGSSILARIYFFSPCFLFW